MKSITTVGLLLALFGAPLQAQEEPLTDADVTLARYEPVGYAPQQLYQPLQMMHGRYLSFADRQVQNIMTIGNEIVVYDTPANVEKILAAARELDGAVEAGEAANDLVFQAGELELETYEPLHGKSFDIAEVASQMFGRQIEVDGRWVQNIRALDNSILVYDTPEQAREIIGTLEKVDAALELKPADRLEVLEYRPRWVGLQTLEAALQPFRRPTGGQVAGMMAASNVSTLYEKGVIVVRDTGDILEQIRETLERVDQPAPQALLSCYVIRGIDGEATKKAPAAVVKNLKALLPYADYEQEALGMLRVSAVSGSQLSIAMDSKPKEDAPYLVRRYELRMAVESFDPEASAMSLSGCTFSVQDPQRGGSNLFSTSATVHGGEYAVLGVAGGDPIFVVLRVSSTTPAGVQ